MVQRRALRSCQELRVVSRGFHERVSAEGSFERLQGELGVLELLAEYLLQLPEIVEDRFKQELAGQCIRLGDRRRTATTCPRAGANFRRHMSAAGFREVDSGISTWTTRCVGPCFAIGVIPLSSWRELQKDNSMDWPFVGSGFGQGFGLVKRSGRFFVAGCARSEFAWGGSCEGDREVFVDGLQDVTDFSVVLDLQRGRVFFQADGSEIAGSSFEIADADKGRSCNEHARGEGHRGGCRSGYRFIASVPPGGSSVTLVGSDEGS